jgi:hypothetical protein
VELRVARKFQLFSRQDAMSNLHPLKNQPQGCATQMFLRFRTMLTHHYSSGEKNPLCLGHSLLVA